LLHLNKKVLKWYFLVILDTEFSSNLGTVTAKYNVYNSERSLQRERKCVCVRACSLHVFRFTSVQPRFRIRRSSFFSAKWERYIDLLTMMKCNDSFSTDQKIPRTPRKPEVYYRVRKSPRLDTTLRQTIFTNPMSCATFLNIIVFIRRNQNHPLSAVRYCLFKSCAAILHTSLKVQFWYYLREARKNGKPQVEQISAPGVFPTGHLWSTKQDGGHHTPWPVLMFLTY
jgi:hypothetical protein